MDDKYGSKMLAIETEFKEKVARAQEETFWNYLDSLTKRYEECSDSDERKNFVVNLEKFLLLPLDNKFAFRRDFLISGFNPKIARKTRDSTNLSVMDLSRKLGIPHPTISTWESGKNVPSVRGKQSHNYLTWLKENGYDPLNLDYLPKDLDFSPAIARRIRENLKYSLMETSKKILGEGASESDIHSFAISITNYENEKRASVREKGREPYLNFLKESVQKLNQTGGKK